MMVPPFWITTSGPSLAQGDYLVGCQVAMIGRDFGEGQASGEVRVQQRDLIVVTQTCDLEASKVEFAALCAVFSLTSFEATNPKFQQRGVWEQVRKGRVEGL